MSNLSTLESLVRLAVPGANLAVIDSPSLWVYINKGVDDVNQRLKILRVNTKFDIVAAQQEYNISDVVPDFVCMDDSGIYWNAGTAASPSWQQLLPKDRKWLDENVYSWRNYIAGTPIYYYQENDILGFVAAPSTAVAQGFWIYFIEKATAMTNGNQYPFTGTVTLTSSFDCLDDGIVAYCQWKLKALLGSKAEGVMDQSEYLAEIDKVDEIYSRRPDMNASRYFKMQGPSMQGGR